MAEKKLCLRHAVLCALIVWVFSMASSWSRAYEKPVGMSLLFQSSGMQVAVLRFDPDGRRGPVPGAVGGMYPNGGAEMSFMPIDNEHDLPKSVTIEWLVATPQYDEEWRVLSSRADKYSKQWIEDVSAVNARAPHHTKRIDLTSVIIPNLVEQVRANSTKIQLRLVITFNNDSVEIKAQAYNWR
jgi:hypothetical protein